MHNCITPTSMMNYPISLNIIEKLTKTKSEINISIIKKAWHIWASSKEVKLLMVKELNMWTICKQLHKQTN